MTFSISRLILKVILFFGLLVGISGCDSSNNHSNTNGSSNIVANKTYKCNILYPAADTLIGMQDSFKISIASSYPNKKIDSVKIYLDKNLVFEDTLLSCTVNLAALNHGGGKKIIKAEAYYNDSVKGISRRMVYLTSGFKPDLYTYKVVNEYAHNANYYTQGFVFYNNFLFEGTGRWGESYIRKLTFPGGDVKQEKKIDDKYFGEGITIFKNKIYQLTYKAQRGFVYNLETFDLISEFNYTGEGWGLTNDSTYLIMSDGSEFIRFLEPETMKEVRRIAVVDDKGPIDNLNELEYVNGEIYANVYLTHQILKIDPETGQVRAIMQMEGLLTPYEIRRADYFNGIAYDHQKKRFLVTGKLWPKIFEVEFKRSPMQNNVQ